MARVNLLGKPYAGQSLIASAQRAINLYAELNKNPNAPAPVTYYQFPGTELFATPLGPGLCRCVYRTSIGTVYQVVGPTVYLLQSNGTMIFVGSIPDNASQVYMADNGLAVVIVDGTSVGYAIDMASNAFGVIIDPSFYGADFVVFLDTFFVLNRPDTNQFYISLSMVDYALLTAGTSFDPLDIAAKAGSADPIVAILTVHDELWLIGELTTEVWIGTGAADFFFQRVQGAYIEHGCIAPYSASNQDTIAFWLMKNRQGKNILVKGQGYQVDEISTPYFVAQLNSYATTADAIGMCLQIQDHAFYLIVFPTANASWLYDLTTEYLSEIGKWNVATNSFDRYRANCCAFGFDLNLIGDYATGKTYKLNPLVYTDGDDPIRWVRTFLHMIGPNFERVIYKNCDLDMEVGNGDAPVDAATDDDDPGINPVVQLRWSDDRGKTFGFPIEQSLGRQGEYLTTISFSRLGMARDRIFEVSWTAPVKTALNGGFVEVQPARS